MNIYLLCFTVKDRFGIILSPIKLKVRLPVVNLEQCSNVYRPHNVNLGKGQVCAGGHRGRDACLGESNAAYIFLSLSICYCDTLN